MAGSGERSSVRVGKLYTRFEASLEAQSYVPWALHRKQKLLILHGLDTALFLRMKSAKRANKAKST